jgi:exonuclease SbcD
MPLFLHASDLHIDSPLDGLDAYPGAPVDRLRGATRRALENLVNVACERKVTFVVLAGDVYDTNPLFETSRFFRGQMQRLHDAGISVQIVRGNHDHAGIAPRNLGLPSRVTVFSHERAESVEAAPGVVVHGRSYPRPDYREDLSKSYPEHVRGALNVGVLHTCLDDSVHLPYAPTSKALLAAHGYAYWALGHVHRARHEQEGGAHIVFPGNLQGRHARETGPKGAVLVDYEGATIRSVDPVVLDVVRWHHLEIDATDPAADVDLRERVRDQLLSTTAADRESGRLCAVRVTVNGSGTNPLDLREYLVGEAQAAGDALWLEKVRVTGAQPIGGRQELEHLRAIAAEIALNPATHDELAGCVEKVRKELRAVDTRLPELIESLPTMNGSGTPQESEHLLQQALRLVASELARPRG